MIQHGTKAIILASIIFLYGCSSEEKNPDTAFKYIKNVFVGDILFDVKNLSIETLKQSIEKNLSFAGTVKEANPLTKDSDAILIVDISPLFIDKNLQGRTKNDVIEVRFSLIAPAKLAIKKTITLKGLIWEKRIFLDSKQEDFDQKLEGSIRACIDDLKENFAKEQLSPTFYL